MFKSSRAKPDVPFLEDHSESSVVSVMTAVSISHPSQFGDSRANEPSRSELPLTEIKRLLKGICLGGGMGHRNSHLLKNNSGTCNFTSVFSEKIVSPVELFLYCNKFSKT
ncbi:hypothetical protein EVAR_43064_1 [Eumeta japonica]|uniref:Uncharacterized protein n=1 Tax=Eumeta variegata TaxID=151549 RepID=A0A4C1WWP5_EUMVA|nr:hypothetical protein EVAR_43064_1 [Eumeta japonica]